MARGGRRAGAGRPLGSKNKRTIIKVPLGPAQAHRQTEPLDAQDHCSNRVIRIIFACLRADAQSPRALLQRPEGRALALQPLLG
jgi:hypothetical protein